jgi:hypothetical protein
MVTFGPVPTDEKFQPLLFGWRDFAFVESTSRLLVEKFAIGLVVFLGLWAGWRFATPTKVEVFILPLWKGTLLFAGTVIVHEFVHLASYPLGQRRRGLGIWMQRAVAYAYYLGPISRNRMVVVLLMPFVVLSLVPLIAATMIKMDTPALAFVSIWNGVGATIDLHFALTFLRRFDRHTEIRNDGGVVWWRSARIANSAIDIGWRD